MSLAIGAAALLAAGAIVAAAILGQIQSVGAFFAGGSLLLVGGVALCSRYLAVASQPMRGEMTLRRLALTNAARRRSRSLAVVGLLASASFLVMSIGVFRLSPPARPDEPQSGTGGFTLMASTSLPIFRDLNLTDSRAAYGLTSDALADARFVAMRVSEGDDASCLNLNRAQRPQLLGVPTDDPAMRAAFRFMKSEPIEPGRSGWSLLDNRDDDATVPAIGDEATVVWGLGKKLGETVTITDDHGRPLRLKIVAVLANSILQGKLMISERQFVKHFPDQAGYRLLLIRTPPQQAAKIQRLLATALQDEGADVASTVERLAAFNTVQNTYLAIFQALGGLGLLLGSVAMAAVVARNVLERRGELALMRAVGFQRGRVRRMILLEHWGLLAGGLTCGTLASAVAVGPALLVSGVAVPWGMLAATLAAIALSGIGWIALAAAIAMRGPLLAPLRAE